MEIRNLRYFPAVAPPARKDGIDIEDLAGLPLFTSRQGWEGNIFRRLARTPPGGGLAFRPLRPRLEKRFYPIRGRHQAFAPIAERFLAKVRRSFGPGERGKEA